MRTILILFIFLTQCSLEPGHVSHSSMEKKNTKSKDFAQIKGMTLSCQRAGQIWASDDFAHELDRLLSLGVNAVAIHPYARIQGDGTVTMLLDGYKDFDYIKRPVLEAKRRGMTIMIKPHIAYWGSPFKWRGDIQFEDQAKKDRFYETYTRWITRVAELSCDADIFAVGTELKGMSGDEQEWRTMIKAVRTVTNAKLTYAANWDIYREIKFWDELDYVGVQGYFPVSHEPQPNESHLEQGWQQIIQELKGEHERLKKPILFTEFGYNMSTKAAKEPWAYEQEFTTEAEKLQAMCLDVGLTQVSAQSDWLNGVFLWKWFAGYEHRANFKLDTPPMRKVLTKNWHNL